jgi:hypothetical protein
LQRNLKNITLFILIIAAINGYSQRKEIHLNSGKVVYGSIYSTTEDSIKVITFNGDFAFGNDEISSITRPSVNTDERAVCFSFNNNLGFGHMSSGVQFHMNPLVKNLYFGAETGLEVVKHIQAPLILTTRYYFPNGGKMTQFFNVSWGWILGMESNLMNDYPAFNNENITFNDRGGPHFSAEYGMMLSVRDNRGMYLKMGYRYEYNVLVANEVPMVSQRTYHRFSLGIGMYIFH